MSEPIKCPACKTPFNPQYLNAGYFISCPMCGTALRVEVFPALYRPVTTRRGETAIEEGQSTCFFHPEKSAEAVCDGCGRFLCGLCDIEMTGKHYCASCIESGKKKGKMPALKNEILRYDKIAGSLIAVSILMWPFSIIAAPAALFISLYNWNKPSSLVQKPHGTFVIVILLSLVICAGWAFLIASLLMN